MKSIEKRLKQIGIIKEYERGALLFCAADLFDGVYYVLSGELCIFKLSGKGEQLNFLHQGPGHMVGLPPLFLKAKKYPAFCHAIRNSKIIFIKKDILIKEMNTNPQITIGLAGFIAMEFMQVSQRLEILTLKTPEQRVILYIISKLAKNHADHLRLELKKLELAQHLDMAPETLSRVLNKLQRDRVIKVDKSVIYIKDNLALRQRLCE